jgi:hypothetical protein
MAVQISAGLSGECLSDADAAEVKSRVEAQARGIVPNAHVLPLCVQGSGTRFGVFARAPASGEETERFTTNLRNLSLSTPFPTNYGIYVSLGLLRAGAQAKLPEIDQNLKEEGATAKSLHVEFSNGKIITRIEGKITKTLPDVPFSAVVRDSFDAIQVVNEQIVFQPSGAGKPFQFPKLRLQCDSKVTLDTDRAALIAAAILTFLAGSLAAAFSGPAAIPFFVASAAAVAQNVAVLSREPPQQGGAACAFVQMVQAADVLLPRPKLGKGTPLLSEQAPMKIAFSYDSVDERPDGLVVAGKLSEQERAPRLGRIRPGAVGAELGEEVASARLSVSTHDLREPLTYGWTPGAGVTLDNTAAASPRATFPLAGIGPDDNVTRRVSVTVTDADELSASADADIAVSVIDPSEVEK